jgi:(1->4)-alpha-D-glucan 1-alpha-D-glucosylmutase
LGAGRRPRPVSTYRLQLHAGFTLDDAAAVAPRLAGLGVTHLYLSPVLQAAPGSTHGYDVVDHSRISEELGGGEAMTRLAAAAHAHGLGVVVDLVPNHVALPVPEWRNPRLWSLLRDGPDSDSARWFDVDWSGQAGSLLVAVLGERIGQAVERGLITLDTLDERPVLRYFDHVLPVRPGTEHLPLPELLDRQWYRLAHWRVADEELNYRRFFDVDTLAGVRVEDQEVFDATHALPLRLHAEGLVDGFRIDHPDGLADPRGYLRRLAAATDGAWVVVEKILEADEDLPADWVCAGTTGYDAANRVLGLLVDPAGAEPLSALWAEVAGDRRTFAEVAHEAKHWVLAGPLRAEVNRLVELAAAVCRGDLMLRDLTRRGLEEALVAVLAAFGVYRAYAVPGEEPPAESVAHVEAAAEAALAEVPERADEVRLVADLALGRLGRDLLRDEFLVRFQQTTGPVMAKGVEDTAFYRYGRLAALNEVGGDPGTAGQRPDRVHAWAERRQAAHPLGQTTLSTHDTKRSEDVRARLALLSEVPGTWAEALAAWREAAAPHRPGAPEVHPADEYLMWQTLLGAWPIDGDRLAAYLMKALREAKLRTTWASPDEAYEASVEALARGVAGDPAVTALVEATVAGLAPHWRSNVLSQKLVQLTLPGVADVYQGCEVVDMSLVDPDNRRPVDHAAIAARLERLDAGAPPSGLDDEKLLVTATALRLRRDHPGWFTGPGASYAPLPTGTVHAFGFVRGGRAVTLATRLPATLDADGGWGPATVALPEGRWTDLLAGGPPREGVVPAAELLRALPVALLVREGDE